MTVQFIEIAGQKVAILPIADYDHLIGLAEDKADIAAAERAELRRESGEDYVPAELVQRLLRGENPLKTWRNHRGLTQQKLAGLAEIGVSYISALESGQRLGKPATWRKLAKALNVDLDDIVVA